METIKYKTNIKCGSCIAKVTPALNSLAGIKNWEVDLINPEKILTVDAEDVSSSVIVQALKDVGYQAEKC